MSYDLSQRKPKDTIAVHLVDPADSKTALGITITLAGKYTPQAKAAQFALADATREHAREDRALDAESAEAMDASLRDLLAACTVTWEGLEDEGVTVPCTPANAATIYEKYRWVREQVQVAYVDTSRFFDAAATPSSRTPAISSPSNG